MVDAIFALTMSPFCLSKNLLVVSGTFHDNKMSFPLSVVLVAVIVGAIGDVVSIVTSNVLAIDLFVNASVAYR